MKNITRGINLLKKQALLVAALASVNKAVATLTPKLDADLAALGYTKTGTPTSEAHDCTVHGQRRVQRAANLEAAVTELVPSSAKQKMSVEQVFAALREAKYTYSLHYTRMRLATLPWTDYGNGVFAFGKLRKRFGKGQGMPAFYWRA